MSEQEHSQSGFTVIEVLVVVAIIGIMANIAIPSLQRAMWRGRAAAVIGDLHAFQRAVCEYERDFHKLPPNGTRNRPIPDFDSYLPPTFRWQKPHPWVPYYIWENWTTKKHGKRLNIQYGLSIKFADDRLIVAIQEIYDGRFEETVYRKHTFVLSAFD